ncbi:MAG: hypothetical protein ACOCXA_02665 [Planctomycetota bacterium]
MADHAPDPAVPITDHAHPRTSWRAIIAVALVAMAIQLLLTVLGAAIGLNIAQDGAGDGLAIGAGIWWVITGCIALFCGGWVTGHLGRAVAHRDAMLHGFIQWTVVTAVSIVLVSTALGALFGGALRLTSTLGSAVGEAVQAVTPEMRISTKDIPWKEVEDEVTDVIARYAPETVGQEDGQQEVDLSALAQRFLTADDHGNEQRTALTRAARKELGISESEAEQLTTELEETYDQARQEARQLWRETEEEVTQAAQSTAEFSADAAWWTFFSLLSGAILAAIGGGVGVRSRPPTIHGAGATHPVYPR